MAKGYVYILSNVSMPGIVKIGKTTRSVEQRVMELYQTGVPSPFEVVASFLTPDCHELEAVTHAHLAQSRLTGGREFFTLSAEEAYSHVRAMHIEQMAEFMDEYLPDHRIIHSDDVMDRNFIVGPEDVWRIARDIGEIDLDVARAFATASPHEAATIVNRWRKEFGETVN
jgi:hypothetical protein